MSSTPPNAAMKKKELRLALVCYGGVSLAIYQHGITKEILKLVRASKAYHANNHKDEKENPFRALRSIESGNKKYSTEGIYFDVLAEIGNRNLELRVIVDVIAGASAGAINGIVLARALAHDLAVEPLTDMWLADADIARILSPEAKARRYHKWYLRPFVAPFFWRLAHQGPIPSMPDGETKKKLSLFLRSRWFHPPFDGPGFSNLLLDAFGAMGEAKTNTASLLPSGHKLDLLVTVTDFYGVDRTIYIHDPPIVWEREHRHILRFTFEHFKGGAVRSDFDLYNVPSLAFAARATSSYPGAFPPARVHEMDSVLAARQQSWPARQQFLNRNFRHYFEVGMNPENAAFVDGSVLNNKPVFEAIEAASGHPAFGEVDRRLVYIDPHPGEENGPIPEIMPGFLQTIRGGLSDLPRYEPIFTELSRIETLNEGILRLRDAIDSTTPHAQALVERVIGDRLNQPADAGRIRQWRLEVAHHVSTVTAPLYNNYMHLMIGAGLDYLTRLICTICIFPQGSPRAHWVAKLLRFWAAQFGIYLRNYETAQDVTEDVALPPFARFVATFDLTFRYRRIQFVLRAINRLHAQLEEPDYGRAASLSLDAVKRQLYRQLDALQEYQNTNFLRDHTASHARNIFSRGRDLHRPAELPEPLEFMEKNKDEISAIIEQIGLECDFNRFSEETDEIMGSLRASKLPVNIIKEIIVTYLGFHAWDEVIFPMISMKYLHNVMELTELNEIKVDRISPRDTTIFNSHGKVLKGGDFGGFAGFFSRTAREHDYLMGRLHGIDRLMDILASSAVQEGPKDIDMRPFKKRAFEIVLDEEAERLPNVAELIAELRSIVADL